MFLNVPQHSAKQPRILASILGLLRLIVCASQDWNKTTSFSPSAQIPSFWFWVLGYWSIESSPLVWSWNSFAASWDVLFIIVNPGKVSLAFRWKNRDSILTVLNNWDINITGFIFLKKKNQPTWFTFATLFINWNLLPRYNSLLNIGALLLLFFLMRRHLIFLCLLHQLLTGKKCGPLSYCFVLWI